MKILILLAVLQLARGSEQEEEAERAGKSLSVFNVVKFPNSVCGATNGFNGTCFTTSECTTLGGTASGTCASSFGVCCVFSIACGSSTSANNSYAIISSYSTSTDADPCLYTFCPLSNDICKLRIDFDVMVLSPPDGASNAITLGDCNTDTLSVSSPGSAPPPIICGYNTGQHMFITASSSCNTVTIDIDTGSTTTTRKWQMKVTQYECGNMMMPDNNCLQYHTAASGTIASFNWDTTATTVAATQYHLSSQYYDICIRRARNFCSVCYQPVITTATISYGLSGGAPVTGVATDALNAVGSLCTGVDVASAIAANERAYGDYIEIANAQSPATPTAGAGVLGINRMCGQQWNSIMPSTFPVAVVTVCSWAVPFKVGVHFNENELINLTPPATANHENFGPVALFGWGYSGFYLSYWQGSC